MAPLVFKTSLGLVRVPEGSTPSLLRHSLASLGPGGLVGRQASRGSLHTVTIVGRRDRGTGGRSRRRGAEEVSAAGQRLAAMAGAQEPVVADAVEARGQDVEQKAADEFASGERHRFR